MSVIIIMLKSCTVWYRNINEVLAVTDKEEKATINMYVGEDLRKKIEEVAEKEERSVSSLARKALKDYIDRLENK